jgi:hypothetical protein
VVPTLLEKQPVVPLGAQAAGSGIPPVTLANSAALRQ